MSLGWLGTFRAGQWQAFRSVVLNERRDVDRRMAVISAELTRIGEVTVTYGKSADGTTITEQRVGITVTQGKSLGKLFQAYAALGGNPFDISLFLSPDKTNVRNTINETTGDLQTEEVQTQPSGGVVYPKSGTYALGAKNEGGFLAVNKYIPGRMGGRTELQDTTVAGAVDLTRRWMHQEIVERKHDLEARIIKLMDLREQLTIELDTLTMATAGTIGAVPTLDSDFYAIDLGVAKIVASIDAIFYNQDADGTTALFNSPRAKEDSPLVDYPSLFLDKEDGTEANTAL